MPVRIEVLLEPNAAHPRLEIDAGVVLPQTDPGRVGSRRQDDLLAIGKPARVAVIDEVIVAVIQFDHGVPGRTYIDAEVAQDALGVAAVDIAGPFAEQSVETVTQPAGCIDTASQIDVSGADAISIVRNTDAPQVVVGGTLGYEVEHSGGIGGTVQRG